MLCYYTGGIGQIYTGNHLVVLILYISIIIALICCCNAHCMLSDYMIMLMRASSGCAEIGNALKQLNHSADDYPTPVVGRKGDVYLDQ